LREGEEERETQTVFGVFGRKKTCFSGGKMCISEVGRQIDEVSS
jgi:hypothetical protein